MWLLTTHIMMTSWSSNGNIFRVTGPLCGESTGHRWIPLTKAMQWCGALMFSLICTWTNSWVNNGDAGDWRRHRAHYDVIAMCTSSGHRHWNAFRFPDADGFPSQRPDNAGIWCFVFFIVSLNKLLNKQSRPVIGKYPTASLKRSDVVASVLAANDSADFIWKQRCHWSKSMRRHHRGLWNLIVGATEKSVDRRPCVAKSSAAIVFIVQDTWTIFRQWPDHFQCWKW